MKTPIFVLLTILLSIASTFAADKKESAKGTEKQSSGAISLDAYLDQVRTQHAGVRGSTNASEGAKKRADSEAGLITGLALTGSAQIVNDEKPGLQFASLTRTEMKNFSLGVQQLTPFGLMGKAYYSMQFAKYSTSGGASIFPPNGAYLVSPTLEGTFSLWRNLLGAETRATVKQVEADARAKSFEESFKVRAALAEAETAYWKLELARQTVSVQKDALDRAKRTLDWNEKRAKLGLADKSDALQAEAAYQLRELQLQLAKDDLRVSSLAFNQIRGVASEEVSEELTPIDDRVLVKTEAVEKTGLRDDVSAAQERLKQQEALSHLGKERNKPTVELFGTYGFNSIDYSTWPAFSDAWGNRPSKMIGLRFTAPLNFFGVAKTVSGYGLEQQAAELNAERKLFEAEQEWVDLNKKLKEAKRRLELARSIEKAQEKKMIYEKERYNRGRTTTYQVLLFEQDYAQSQLTRIQAQAEILSLVARIKTYQTNSITEKAGQS